jgi:uncharacterized protein YciI
MLAMGRDAAQTEDGRYRLLVESTEVFQGSLPKTVHEIDSQDPTWAAGMMAAAGSAWG